MMASEIKDSLAPEVTIRRWVTEAQTEAYDAALADAARTLKRIGSLKAAKMIEALARDQKRMRDGKPTEFAALRESVLLPR